MNIAGSQKNGSVLIYVMLVIIFATLLGSALYESVFLSNRLFIQQQNNKLAYYVAVSGVEYAFYIIKSGHYTITDSSKWPYPSFDPTGGTVPGTLVTVTITSSGSPPVYTITSAAQYPGATKTIKVKCTPTGSVTSWDY